MSTTTTPNNSTASAPTWSDTATQAIQRGMEDAQQSVERAIPKLVEYSVNGIYGLGYGLGYGLTFPSVLLARSVPQENCVVWGLIDGAQLAHEAANRPSQPKG